MLIGEHIYLRKLETADASMLAQWSSDPEFLGEFFNIWPESARDWQKDVDEAEKRDRSGTFVIASKRGDTPRGIIGYYRPYTIDMYPGLEIWYQVHQSARKQGVATQSAALLVNHLFSSLPGVERIEATTHTRNTPSQRVLQKAGMSVEGVRQCGMFLHGAWADINIHAITRRQWKSEEEYRVGREF